LQPCEEGEEAIDRLEARSPPVEHADSSVGESAKLTTSDSSGKSIDFYYWHSTIFNVVMETNDVDYCSFQWEIT